MFCAWKIIFLLVLENFIFKTQFLLKLFKKSKRMCFRNFKLKGSARTGVAFKYPSRQSKSWFIIRWVTQKRKSLNKDLNEIHKSSVERMYVCKIYYSVHFIHCTEKYFPFWTLKNNSFLYSYYQLFCKCWTSLQTNSSDPQIAHKIWRFKSVKITVFWLNVNSLCRKTRQPFRPLELVTATKTWKRIAPHNVSDQPLADGKCMFKPRKQGIYSTSILVKYVTEL
jgi:hypothetical protein